MALKSGRNLGVLLGEETLLCDAPLVGDNISSHERLETLSSPSSLTVFVGDITGEGVAQRSTLGLGTLVVLAAAGLLGSLDSC